MYFHAQFLLMTGCTKVFESIEGQGKLTTESIRIEGWILWMAGFICLWKYLILGKIWQG